ncbi:HSP90 family protein [Spongiactinospora sp. TRM90649]|uniref:HSP90 family protein n=1 Tax=Spongiactinospora sp. TRM90649 TaxID=3031114 RepID=UPI0023F7A2FD|nr:HSP90 family protein [Spongiactinospora sp. TRM90649]MDF5758273.1 HSP90 family protein [Spongiactinospora sp. TRM90649]
MESAFQVDLRGVVDLLSRHLYSSPRVYVRELLQNAVDAITARQAADPGAPARIDLEIAPGGPLRVHDTGIGLTEQEVHTLLATIGRSSKRDELGFARHEFLGQFGIGLLSGFLVADAIEVVTRSATGGPTVRWTGFADGRYRVEQASEERAEPGTTVTLSPRADAGEWVGERTVTELATLYGSLLPVEVHVAGRRISGDGPPWTARHATPDARRAALTAYGAEAFGFSAFDVVDLNVPEAGLTGVAFILPTPANPAVRSSHRVYLKRMLLAEGTEGLLPEWAFFARCVVDAGELRPTASREALYDDDLLEHTRDALGTSLRAWLVTLAETDPARLRAFLRLHHLGVKALALHDDDMLRLVDRWLEFETSDGPMTLAQFRVRHPQGRYTSGVDEFRQLSGVAGAQGVGLVNAGYVYDSEILSRLPRLDPEIRLRPLDPAELATRLAPVDPHTELSARPFLVAAAGALDALGCEVVLREFDPASLPALYLTSRAAQHQAELREAREDSDGLWADVLGAIENVVAADRPRLVLNHRNPLVRRIVTLPDASLAATAVEALYGMALLHGRHPLRAADTASLNRSFLGLLDWAVLGKE